MDGEDHEAWMDGEDHDGQIDRKGQDRYVKTRRDEQRSRQMKKTNMERGEDG